MRIIDALGILGLSVDANADQIKSAYKKACIKYHPDRNPAGLEIMKVINQAFDALSDYEPGSASGTVETGYDELLNDALNAVIVLSGVDVEICGNWIWLSGNTREHKDVIKGVGFKWSRNKTAWYFRPEKYRSYNRGRSWSMDEIRINHGSSKPNFNHRQQIAAA